MWLVFPLQNTKVDILKNVSTIFVHAVKVSCVQNKSGPWFSSHGQSRGLLHYSLTDPGVSILSHLQLLWVWSRDRWPVGEREPGSQA